MFFCILWRSFSILFSIKLEITHPKINDTIIEKNIHPKLSEYLLANSDNINQWNKYVEKLCEPIFLIILLDNIFDASPES